ncbi:LysR family transcriptional regulator [Falsiphaeobacter marinintestinus]|uniref:LysR family transcriptional regulator n=1 Tax=Falsiphaeobacter marinintestinus TaxID=1492905 RepID=UPI0011B5A0CF|nr:LysR family transcriptional regulator [Phaeobacter marinintestinus]
MNLSSFDLNLLQVLDALLETRSTTRAGQRVGLSQPAVSAALARLRDALGDPILIRQGRKMVATDYAGALRDPLRAVLEQTEQLLSGNATFDPQKASMTIRISGSDFYSVLLMPHLADRVSRSAPGIRLQQVDLVPDSHIRSIDQHNVDMAILPEGDFPDWIDHQTAHRSTFVAIARPDHPDLTHIHTGKGDQIPLDLFCGLPHVAHSPEGQLHMMGDAALARIGRRRNVAMTLPTFAGVCLCVASSNMIALVPAQIAAFMAPRIGLSIYDPPVLVPAVNLVLVWHKRSSQNPVHCWLRQQIVDALEKIDDPSGIAPFPDPASQA